MSRVADFCPKCKLYYPGDCMKSGCQDRYCECDGCNAGEGVVFSKLSEKNTPSQSIVKVDPEGSCKKDNLEPVCKCIHCAYCHLDNCCTCEECKYEDIEPEGSCKKDNQSQVNNHLEGSE